MQLHHLGSNGPPCHLAISEPIRVVPGVEITGIGDAPMLLHPLKLFSGLRQLLRWLQAQS